MSRVSSVGNAVVAAGTQVSASSITDIINARASLFAEGQWVSKGIKDEWL